MLHSRFISAGHFGAASRRWLRRKSSYISPSSYSSHTSPMAGAGAAGNVNNTTFVSKHHTISPADLSKVVGVNGHFQDYRLKDTGELHVKTCFNKCARGNKGVADNAWKLTIRRDGSFYCYRCGDKGNWYQLKQRINGGQGVQVNGFSSSGMSNATSNAPYPSSSEALGQNSDHESVDSEIEVLHSNIRNSHVSSNKNDIVLPNQQDAFGYHLDLTAAIYSNNTQSYSEQAAIARTELQKMEEEASRAGHQLKIPSVISRALVREYLREERGLSDDVIVRYGVGCAVHPFPVYKETTSTNDEESGKESKKKSPTWTDKVCVTFPWFSRKSVEDEGALAKLEEVYGNKSGAKRVVRPEGDSQSSFFIKRIKLRSVDTKGMQRTLPKGGGWGFFGWQTVQPHHKSVIITEGEYDAMAVAQGMMGVEASHELAGVPAISLPNGCNSLPPNLLPCLEQFDRIYLWLDNDQPGQEASDKFARKLGIHRCRIVRPPDSMKNAPKDANDALRMMLRRDAKYDGSGADEIDVDSDHADLIPRMLLAAQPISHQRLETFSTLRSEVLRNIRQPQTLASGAAIQSMPQLNSMLKGLRKGELCVLTGPTGCGKTTLLSQISLDLAKQGASTLWGSFEIQNAMLLEKMMQQFGGINLKTLSDDGLESLADDFEGLPLKFMNFHAGTDMSQVLEAMDFAVYRDDVRHIIIDNLQFMMPRSVIPGITSPTGAAANHNQNQGFRPASSFDRFTSQDAVIDEFRRFATEKRVNIILVIHPRKEDDNQVLGMSSIFGSAKATQEADIVLILQRIAASRRFGGGAPPGGEEVPESMALSVKKNRYSGHTGKIDIAFNPAVSSFYEVRTDK